MIVLYKKYTYDQNSNLPLTRLNIAATFSYYERSLLQLKQKL